MDLTYKKKNIYAAADEAERKRIFEYCEGYKKFLDNGKTEREAVAEAIKMAKKNGYKPYTLGDKISKGDKLYYNNRGKSLFLLRAGTADIAKNGVRILVAHVDSPRLDLKQVPLYEKSDIAFLKTHYYGGIKKYHWLTIPLALHGVVVLKDGKTVNVNIGEAETDPVFYITDLLPHLSQELNTKTIAEGFKAENLNLIVGGMPAHGEETDAVKKGVLALLNEKYGMTEEDFLSAELEAVPAVKAKDVGLDRAFIASYGHDDSVCAYPEITATLQTETDQTVLTILADKEEIGSEGNTGMQCILIHDILDEIAKSYGVNPAVLREHSMCISADVTAAYDPTFASAFEEMNVGLVSRGVTMNKFTGARGKSGSNDASAEFVGYLRGVFDKANVVWQTGELGRVDLGGGGTVAKYIAKNNIDTVDMGVPVLSMHAPYELVSKADIYSAHLAFAAFIK
ncbi:MAG: aminopeptidase [Clostridiales bacterium]|nr:aminopeptidase [Clostridiales bacterium]